MFLEAVKKEASSSSDVSSGVGCSPLPLPEICERCRLERKHHRFGCLDELHALSCPMLQPGNGPFRLRKGGILIGEAHAPGFVLRSQELFLQLFDRVKKVIASGSEGGNGVRDTLRLTLSNISPSFATLAMCQSLGKKMKNSPGGTVEETGLPAVVVVVDYVGAICNTSLTATFLRSTFV